LDNIKEIDAYEHVKTQTMDIGIHIATQPPFRTSRLGIKYDDVDTLFRTRIQHNSKFRLKLLHFFVDIGIRDSTYYWTELAYFIYKYFKFQRNCADLNSIEIGSGLSIAHSLDFPYDYGNIIDQIIAMITIICSRNIVSVTHLFTGFGSYTVGESGAII
jgi:arginine decarboxylase